MAKGKYKRKRERVLRHSESQLQSKANQNGHGGNRSALPQAQDENIHSGKALTNADKSADKSPLTATVASLVKEWHPFRNLVRALPAFVIGVVLGPMIQQRFFTWIPGSRTQADLRGELITGPDEPDCRIYKFMFINFDAIDYMHVKLQFPYPITSARIGVPPQNILSDDQGTGRLNWQKGWNSQHKCIVENNDLSANPNVQSSVNGHTVEVQTSKLPDSTYVVALIATTSGMEPGRSKLWTGGDYEYSKFGLTIRKKLAINLRIMAGAE